MLQIFTLNIYSVGLPYIGEAMYGTQGLKLELETHQQTEQTQTRRDKINTKT